MKTNQHGSGGNLNDGSRGASVSSPTPVGTRRPVAGKDVGDHLGKRAHAAVLAGAAAMMMAFAACSLPQAQSDPTRFFVLSTTTPPAAAPAANLPTVHLRQIEVASYLRARPLIVRRGENELEFREFARWGESLDVGIARVLREELLARGAAGAVPTGGLRAHTENNDFTLNVRVLACEGAPHGAVNFRAVWDLTKGAGKAPVASGDYRPTDLRWDGKSEASLAAQLSRAVAGLAEEIAVALKK